MYEESPLGWVSLKRPEKTSRVGIAEMMLSAMLTCLYDKYWQFDLLVSE